MVFKNGRRGCIACKAGEGDLKSDTRNCTRDLKSTTSNRCTLRHLNQAKRLLRPRPHITPKGCWQSVNRLESRSSASALPSTRRTNDGRRGRRNQTHLKIGFSNFTSGSITLPCSSTALDILRVASIDAIKSQTDDSTRCIPGHCLQIVDIRGKRSFILKRSKKFTSSQIRIQHSLGFAASSSRGSLPPNIFLV